MSLFAVDHPLVLTLLVFCVPPLLGLGSRWARFPSLIVAPPDSLSHVLDWCLRGLAALPVAAIVLGLAGLHEGQQTVQRIGQGAHIVVALDRSLSMDEKFAVTGETAHDNASESKTHAAARMLADFFARRPHDSFGIVAFSTSPIPAMPLTAHRAAIAATVAAMDRKALANTDIGGAIALGLWQFDHDTPGAARALVLITDGAGAIPEQTQSFIRAEILRTHTHLYYLYLRAGDDPPLAEGDATNDMSQPAGLDAFFRNLGVNYVGFEARDAGAVEAAARRIEALETQAIAYSEVLPRRNLDMGCYVVAALSLAASLAFQLVERG